MASTHTEPNLVLSNDYSLESAMEGVPNPIPVPITQAFSGLDSPLPQKSPMPQSETLTNLSDTSQHSLTQMHPAPRSPYSQSSNLNNSVQQSYVCDNSYPNQSNYSSNQIGQQPVYHQMGVSGASESSSPNHNVPSTRNNDYNKSPKQTTPPLKQKSTSPVQQNNDQGMLGNQGNQMGMASHPLPPSLDQSQYQHLPQQESQYHYHQMQPQPQDHHQTQSNYQYPHWQPPIETTPPHQHQNIQNNLSWQQQQDMSWPHQSQIAQPMQQDHSFQQLQQQPNQDQSQQFQQQPNQDQSQQFQQQPNQDQSQQFQQQPNQDQSQQFQQQPNQDQSQPFQQQPNQDQFQQQPNQDQFQEEQHYPPQQHYNYSSMNYNHPQYYPEQIPPHQQQYHHQMMPPYMPPQPMSQSHQPPTTPGVTQQPGKVGNNNQLPPAPNQDTESQLPLHQTQPSHQIQPSKLPPASQRLVDCVKKSQEKFDKPPEAKLQAAKPEKPTKIKVSDSSAPRGKGTKRKNSENKTTAKANPTEDNHNPKVAKKPPEKKNPSAKSSATKTPSIKPPSSKAPISKPLPSTPIPTTTIPTTTIPTTPIATTTVPTTTVPTTTVPTTTVPTTTIPTTTIPTTTIPTTTIPTTTISTTTTPTPAMPTPPTKNPAPKPPPSKISISRKNVFERKNIRDIIQDEELEATTVAAQKEEQERKRRLQEAQQRALVEKFNQVIQEAEQETAAKAAAEAVAKAEAEAAAAIKKEMEEEAEAIAIKIENVAPEINFKHMGVKKETDVILVESSDDDDKRKRNLNMYSREAVKVNPVITVSSSDEDSSSSTDDTSSDEEDNTNDLAPKKVDDDCVMVLSDDDDDDETLSEDPNNSGSHTNDLFNQPDSEGRVLVNVGHPPEEEDIFLAPQLSRAVKSHQIGGIRFLYDNVVESITRFPTSSGFGCILAHSMGLGKTIQVISLTDTFLRHTPATTVLCIVPINTIQNWMSEFNMWLPSESAVPQLLVDSNEIRPRNFPVYLLNENYRTTATRAKVITEWRESGGVMLMGYEMYRMLALKKPAKVAKRRKNRKKEDINPMEVEDDSVDKKLLDDIFLALVNPGPDLVICDEGHRIKNCSASTSSALKKIHTKRRVVLTGYPLQNNLLEYWCMVDFVRPNYLGSRSEFVNMFERPIQNGQCIDSTPRDIQLMRYRAHVLHSLLEGFVQRRGHAVLRTSLPMKEEHVVLCRMTDVQRELYREFVRDFHTRSNSTNPLLFFAVCCKIWNHPDVLYNFVKNLKSQVVVADNDLDIDLVQTAADKASLLNKNLVSQALNASQSPMNHAICDSPPPLNGSSNVNGSPPVIGLPEIGMENKPPLSIPAETSFSPPVKEKPEPAISYEWAKTLMETYKTGVIENCHKMAVLFAIIEQSLAVGDKLLVFSQSLLTLDLIERFLNERQIPDRPNCPLGERWSRNFNYCRLDGKTHAQERERLINNFNSNQSMYLFLLSTRAGCLGINLIGANRIVVYDASWNPCHDAQAVCRIYRYGQQKPCYIYRLVTDNCLEKKVYDRQVNKQGMSDRVVDELNPESNFTWKEVSTLVSESEDDGPEQDFSDKASKYVDHLLQFICNSMSKSLSREPFEHESLLLDRKELKLTKHEKKMAKQSYELEKRGNACGYGRGYTYYSRGGIIQRGAYQGRGPMTFASPTGIHGPRFLPNQSTPVPNQWNRNNQKNSGATVLIRAMLHQGVMVRRVTPSNGDSSTVTIPAGQEVLVMRTPKGVYLRVPDGRIIAVRLPQELLNQWQAIGTTTTIGLGGPPTPRPNLLRTHLMTSTTNTATTTSNCKGNFGTNIVQANLQCGGTIKVDGNPEVIDLSDDEEKQRAASISPNSSLLSSAPLSGNITMTTTTVSAGAINKMSGRQIPRIIKLPIPQNELQKVTNPHQPARIIIRQANRNLVPNLNPGMNQTVTFTRQNTLGGTPSVTITRLPISTSPSANNSGGPPPDVMGNKLEHNAPNLSKNFSNLTIKRGGLHQASVTVVRPGMLKNQPIFHGGTHVGPQGKVIVKKTLINNSPNMEVNQIDSKMIDESSKPENKSEDSSSTIPGNYQMLGNENNNGPNHMNQHVGLMGMNSHAFPDPSKSNENLNGPMTENLQLTLPGQSVLQKQNMDSNLAKMGQINPARIINTYSPRRGRGGQGRCSKQASKRGGAKYANNKNSNNSMCNINNNSNEMFLNHQQLDNSRLGNMNSSMVGQLNETTMLSAGSQPNMGENHPPFINMSGPPLMLPSQNTHNSNQTPLGHVDGLATNNNSMMDFAPHPQSHQLHQQLQPNQQQQPQQQPSPQQRLNPSSGSLEQASGVQNNNLNSGNNTNPSNIMGGLQPCVDSNQMSRAQLNQSPMNQSQGFNSFENSPSSRQSPAKHLTLLGEPQKQPTKLSGRANKKSKNPVTTHSASSTSSSSSVSNVTNQTFTYGNSLTDPQNMGFSPMDQSTSLRSYGDDPYRQDPLGYGMYDQNYYAPPPADPLSQNRTDGGYNPYGISNQGYSSFSNPLPNSLNFSDQPAHMSNFYDPAGVGGGLNPFGHYSASHSGFNYNPYGNSSSTASTEHVANHTFLPSYETFSSPASPKYGNAPAPINNPSPTGNSTSSRQSPFPNAAFSSRNPSQFLPPSSQPGNSTNSSATSQMQGYGFNQTPYDSPSPQPLQNVFTSPP